MILAHNQDLSEKRIGLLLSYLQLVGLLMPTTVLGSRVAKSGKVWTNADTSTIDSRSTKGRTIELLDPTRLRSQ